MGDAEMKIEERAAEFVRNYEKFTAFGWTPPEGEWGIHYTHNRDSERLERVNAEVFDRELRDEEDVLFERHRHWAVGWVEGFAIRVYDDNGAITGAFRKFHDLMERLEEYPILDDDRYSEVENDELAQDLRECIDCVVRSKFDFDVSDDLVRKVDGWIQRNDANVYYEEGWQHKEPAVEKA
ncbi:MAG: hypothetical protein EBU90_28450, partial [Proteobacteria bacterium]|nr:hypothetical protein [Pseudomonadota bacterium]